MFRYEPPVITVNTQTKKLKDDGILTITNLATNQGFDVISPFFGGHWGGEKYSGFREYTAIIELF